MTTIRVTGLKELQKFMKNLEPKLRKKVGKEATNKLAKNLQGRIRRRYTLAGYGKMATSGRGFKSIIAQPTTGGALVQIGKNAPWMAMLEKGVRSHWVSPYTIKQHLKSPGSTFGKKAPEGEWGGPPVWWHWKGPFVEPAMMSFRPEIPKLLNQYVQQAIKEAK